MSDFYAQYDGEWISMSWNTMPDGSGTGGNPLSGDTAYANGHLVNMRDVDLSGVSFGSGDGTFWSSIWYAMGAGRFNEVYWNTHQTGMGYVDPMGHLPQPSPPGQACDLSHNGYAIDIDNVDMSPFGGWSLDGTYWWSSKVYANANGAWNACGWNTSQNTNGAALEFPGPFNAGTPTACIGSRHVTALPYYIITPVSVTTGSLTIGDPGIVYPGESDVRTGVQYGPTGTEYTGTLESSGAAEIAVMLGGRVVRRI